MFDEYPFALCLTHDLDRPYKSIRAVYYALRERRLSHLGDLIGGRNPYWQFDPIAQLENARDVRSAFYVLNEPHLIEKGPRAWLSPVDWIQQLGRYDLADRTLLETLRGLSADGWEIGLHGSYRSKTDVDRLAYEKRTLEDRVGTTVVGGRQHYLRLDVPETWRHHARIGLRYDSSLGSSEQYGFQYGYRPIRPFDDEFVVFPLTVMESALPDPGTNFAAAWSACEALLEEAAANEAVMTALWHPRFFSQADFPGYRRLYRRLLDRAIEMGAWVGPPRDCYRELDIERDCRSGLDGVTKTLTKP